VSKTLKTLADCHAHGVTLGDYLEVLWTEMSPSPNRPSVEHWTCPHCHILQPQTIADGSTVKVIDGRWYDYSLICTRCDLKLTKVDWAPCEDAHWVVKELPTCEGPLTRLEMIDDPDPH
jgi:hypothetical protein